MGRAPDRERWNARHAAAAARTADELPDPWLVEHRDLLTERLPGRALDVASGRGRNAVFLAELGFEVDAVDVSDVAIEAIRARAQDRGLPITAERADLSSDALPAAPYDVVVVVDFLDRSLFGALEAALTPGGLLVAATFTCDHPTMNPAYTLADNELLRAFPALRVLRYRDTGPRAAIVARRT